MKIKFITLGCKVNQYETQGLKEKFASFGAKVTQDKADCYIINTCTVTQRADRKSKDAVLMAKKENPAARIIVCGCLAQSNRDSMEALGVDLVVSQDKKHLLPEIILGVLDGQSADHDSADIWSLAITRFSQQRAFVKIQDGCDKYCSFCKIPYVRGPSRSRQYKQVLDECALVSRQHQEIVLCGINLGLYGKDLSPRRTLAGLVADILNIPTLGRLRLSSIEPSLADKALRSLLANPKFCPHFHFPFQYGDDRILQAMNKKERVETYDKVVGAVRRINPDAAVSCDIMVGFPGENEKTFANTVQFLRRIQPMRMHIFSFSPREKTPLANAVAAPSNDTRRRYGLLKSLADELSGEYAKKFIGRTLSIVPERRQAGFSSGYSENYLKIYVRGELTIGKLTPVKVKSLKKNKIYGNAS